MSLASERPARAVLDGRPGAAADERPRVALVGNPNTGKTSLFNRLCGVRAKTANFPGTTTDLRVGRATLDGAAGPLAVEVFDLPGLYRVGLQLPEARIVAGILAGDGLYRPPDALVVVVDATNLARNLNLVGEALRYGLPTVVALNMVDLAQRRGLTIDARRLARHLGCPVVPIVARKGTGCDALVAAITLALTERPLPVLPDALHFGSAAAEELPIDVLEGWADRVVADSVGGEAALGSATDTMVERLDQTFTHPVGGVLIFGLVMAGLFWTIFTLASMPMDLIEAVFRDVGSWVEAHMAAGAVRDLVAGGIVSGIAATVVFVPQICLLFFLISLLEDTGYLARAAFVMDRLLCRFGLPGYAFVPLLAAHACALPAILSTKLIPDRHDRLTTILVAPFMSCSARLPVYVLITSLLFRDRPLLAGLAFAGCYVLGALAAMGSALIARRTLLRGRSRPMVLELPTYKLPSLRNAALTAVEQGLRFLRTAGTVILTICIVMWWLSAYPKAAPPPAAVALRAQAAALGAGASPAAANATVQRPTPAAPPAEVAARSAASLQTPDASLQAPAASLPTPASLLRTARGLEARHQQAESFAGRLGRTVQPIFAPLGYDWQLTDAVLTSFVAREVFVSTLSVLLTGVEDPEQEDQGVLDRIRAAQRDDGSVLLTPATCASLLVFFVLAMQCLPTLAMTRRQAGGIKWSLLQLGWMSTVAYTAAFLTLHGLHLFGVT